MSESKATATEEVKDNRFKKRWVFGGIGVMLLVVLLIVVFLNFAYMLEVHHQHNQNTDAQEVARKHNAYLRRDYKEDRFKKIKKYLPHRYGFSLNDLTELHIQEDATDDDVIAVVEVVREIKTLKKVHVSWCPLSQIGFEAIASLPNLEEVSFIMGVVDDKAISGLKVSTTLRRLDLGSNENIKGSCLGDLTTIETLEELGLSGTKVTDKTVKLLHKSISLKKIQLPRIGVTKHSLPHLAKIPSLESCEMRLPGRIGYKSQGFTLDDLRGLKKYSFLHQLKLSHRGIAYPHQSKYLNNKRVPFTKIQIDENQIFRNSCFKEIVSMKNVEELEWYLGTLPNDDLGQLPLNQSIKKLRLAMHNSVVDPQNWTVC